MNASPIPKITSWLKFLGKNLHLVGCATLCAKSEVMLITVEALGRSSRVDEKSTQRLVNIVDLKYVCTNYFIGGITLLSFELFLGET